MFWLVGWGGFDRTHGGRIWLGSGAAMVLRLKRERDEERMRDTRERGWVSEEGWKKIEMRVGMNLMGSPLQHRMGQGIGEKLEYNSLCCQEWASRPSRKNGENNSSNSKWAHLG